MRIVIQGTGYVARLVEEYIKQDVEIMMYIDNNKMIGGGAD